MHFQNVPTPVAGVRSQPLAVSVGATGWASVPLGLSTAP